jgi:tRNA(Leu) C34 or U34 (ribose-2'-O)-methylase TrmL
MKDKMIISKGTKYGTDPSVILTNPKFAHNLGQTIRACSCFDVKQLWYTGNRIQIAEGERIPREERMKGYRDVELIQYDYPLDQFQDDVVPVAIEISPTAEVLTEFEHPDKAVYVFGPEDGSLAQVYRKLCHRFVIIPTNHCTNLSAAVYLVLYDRRMKRQLAGKERIIPASQVLHEVRGYDEFDSL